MRDLSRSLGYCRVSTQRQHTEGHGLERYIEQLKNYGLTEERIYWDIESGSNEKRTGYNKVLSEVRSRNVDKIIVPCFDRFTRSPLGWEQAKNELLEFGVELIFIDGGSLNLETPEGLFTSRILAAMSAQVRDKNRYNSIQGHRFFQEKRKIYQAVCGLIKDGDTVRPNLNIYKNNKTYQQVAIEAIDLFLECGNLTKVVKTLCERYGYERNPVKHLDFPHSPSALRRWMENPILCGMIRYYAEEKEKTLVLSSNHGGIISIDKFNQVCLLLSKNPGGRSRMQTNPLVSLCYCGACGAKMKKITNTIKKKSGKTYVKEYLHCTAAKPRAGKPQTCDYQKFFKQNDAIFIVIAHLKKKAIEIVEAIDREENIKIPDEVFQLQQEIIKLKNLGDSDYQSVIIRKEQKLESLLKSTEVKQGISTAHHELYTNLLRSDTFWDKATKSDLTIIFHELVERVVCFDNSDKGHTGQGFIVTLKS